MRNGEEVKAGAAVIIALPQRRNEEEGREEEYIDGLPQRPTDGERGEGHEKACKERTLNKPNIKVPSNPSKLIVSIPNRNVFTIYFI